jgi:hypothetical protein
MCSYLTLKSSCICQCSSRVREPSGWNSRSATLVAAHQSASPHGPRQCGESLRTCGGKFAYSVISSRQARLLRTYAGETPVSLAIFGCNFAGVQAYFTLLFTVIIHSQRVACQIDILQHPSQVRARQEANAVACRPKARLPAKISSSRRQQQDTSSSRSPISRRAVLPLLLDSNPVDDVA